MDTSSANDGAFIATCAIEGSFDQFIRNVLMLGCKAAALNTSDSTISLIAIVRSTQDCHRYSLILENAGTSWSKLVLASSTE